MAERVPMFNAPGIVVGAIGVLVLIHVALWLMPPDLAGEIIYSLGFSPARYGAGAVLPNGWPMPGGLLAAIASPVTHTLIHGDATHLIMNSAWMLAFGTAVARRIGNLRFAALFVVGALAGALTFFLAHPSSSALVIGASGAISALMGAAFRFVFRAAGWGMSDTSGGAATVPRMSLREVVGDRSLMLSIGIYVVVNFLLALWSSGLTSAGGIAWEAHLGGFFAGLLLFDLFDRPAPPPARLRIVERDPSRTLH